MANPRELRIEEIIKSSIIDDLKKNITRLERDEKYWDSEECSDTEWYILNKLKVYFNWDWNEDEDAASYFLKATSEEAAQYIIDLVIPQLKLKVKI